MPYEEPISLEPTVRGRPREIIPFNQEMPREADMANIGEDLVEAELLPAEAVAPPETGDWSEGTLKGDRRERSFEQDRPEIVRKGEEGSSSSSSPKSPAHSKDSSKGGSGNRFKGGPYSRKGEPAPHPKAPAAPVEHAAAAGKGIDLGPWQEVSRVTNSDQSICIVYQSETSGKWFNHFL